MRRAPGYVFPAAVLFHCDDKRWMPPIAIAQSSCRMRGMRGLYPGHFSTVMAAMALSGVLYFLFSRLI
jgi:hypothetical protein